jgi:hypothetical protein
VTVGTVSFCPDGYWLDCLSLIIAAQIRENGHEVHYIDGDNLMIPPKEVGDMINKIRPDYVVLNTETIDYFRAPLSSYENINAIVDRIDNNHKTVVIIYGTHPCIETVGLSDRVDYVVKGEGDAIVSQLIDGADLEDKIYRVKDIDSLPFPAYDMAIDIPQECSNFAYEKFNEMKFTQSVLSRGCKIPTRDIETPACKFCCRLATGTKYRAMSPRKVLEYFKYLKSFGYQSTYIIDDCHGADIEWGKEVCRELILYKNEIQFSIQTRVDVVLDDEYVELLKKAGCSMVGLGIESYNDDLLEVMGKKVTCEKIDSALSILKEHNIDVTAFLQLGLPTELELHRNNTEAFLCKMFREEKLFASGPFLSCPYVGSLGWEVAKDAYPYYTVLESLEKAGIGARGIIDMYRARKMFCNYDLGESIFPDVPSPVTDKKVWSRPASILQQIQKYRPDVFKQWWRYIKHIGWDKRLEKYFKGD